MVTLGSDERGAIVGRLRELGFTQPQMAKLLGIIQPRLSEKLKGRREFLETEVATLAAVLEMDDLAQRYPEHIGPEEKAQRDFRLALEVLTESLQELKPHDRREIYFVIALLLEAKRPYGTKPHSTMLRTLARLMMKNRPSEPPAQT